MDISALVSTETATGLSDFWPLIHPSVVGVARSRFESGHFADSVEAALKHFNGEVKRRVAGLVAEELDGARLMTRVFSVDKPVLELDDLSTESGRSVQQGYMQMFAGAMTGVRNPKAHANVSIDRQRAIHFLYLVSLFFWKSDEGA